MKKIPFTNTHKVPVHIDGKRIEPGLTRDVDPSMIPESMKAAETAVVADEPPASMLNILDKTIPEIVVVLPWLSDQDLDDLKAAEMAGKTRAGLMKAIAEEELKRANAKIDGEGTPETGDAGGDSDPAIDVHGNGQ